jgi:hypothetical protein
MARGLALSAIEYQHSIGLNNPTMKKLFWILPVGLLGIGTGLGYFYWEQATAIPEWYTEEEEEVATSPSPTSASPFGISASPSAIGSSGRPGSVTSSPNSSSIFRSPTVSAIPQVSATPKALPYGIQSIKTKIRQNELRAGTLVDLAAMETTTPGRQGELVQKLLVVMPHLRGRKVFLGVRGQLVEQNGQWQLSAQSKLSIGKVEFSLDEVAAQMSMTRADLDRMILSYLQLNKPVSSSPTTSKSP